MFHLVCKYFSDQLEFDVQLKNLIQDYHDR